MALTVTFPPIRNVEATLINDLETSGTNQRVAAVLSRHQDDVSDVLTDEGLEALQTYVPHIDKLGWIAINGIYKTKWLRGVAHLPNLDSIHPSLPNSPFYSLAKLYGHLSTVGTKNQVTGFVTDLKKITVSKSWHYDHDEGHTFLSNFQLKNRGNYAFLAAKGRNRTEQKLGIRTNQLVILGGSAVKGVTSDIERWKSVKHTVQGDEDFSRIRLMVYSQ